MATFTITTTKNIDELTGKTGGDIYNVNGGTLNIDQHSRFGLNNNNSAATTATSMGNIVLSSTLGGIVNFDARYIRLIPFNSGSGTIPALNSTVTQGSASGKLMCVYSSLTAAPLVNGGTMPASGWIMIKQWNSIEYSASALTLSGVTATATGASVVGFMEIFGDDSSSLTAVRLGTVNFTGNWYQVGTTNGTSNQTMQIPNNGTLKHIAGVYIEKTVGGNDYEFYPNAGTVTTTGTDSFRGKVVWIDNTGLVRIGNSGAATNGYTPVTNLKVVVPNIFLQCCLTTARNAEVIPNATVGTRYDFTTTGGGVITADKVNFAWYPSFSQAYSIQLTNCAIVDAMTISENATACNWTNVGVGNKPTTALLVSPLTMSLMPAGGTFTDCVWNRVSHAASGAHTLTLTDIVGFNFVNNTIRAGTIRANATTYSVNATRLTNCNFTNCNVIQGNIYLAICDTINITDTKYVDCVSGTTVTTYAMYVVAVTTASKNVIISGLTIPVTNTHPYTAFFALGAAGNSNIVIKNIGTRVAPLTCGSANICGYFIAGGTGSATYNLKVQRCYVTATRSGFSTLDNSNNGVIFENCAGDYADADTLNAANMLIKSVGFTHSRTAQTAVYGTHFTSVFTSTTAGAIVLMSNEKTASEPSNSTYSITSGNVSFTAAGGLYMPTIGMQIEYTMPFYAKGHTSFANAAPTMAGGTIGNYLLEFKIDKNDGNGFSANWTTMSQANLFAISGINATLGFKFKWRITTTTGNTAAITSLYVTTVSSTTAQDYLYPLESYSRTLSLTGLQLNSEIRVYAAGTSNELTGIENSGTSFNYNYTWEDSDILVDIVIFNLQYQPLYFYNYALTSSNASIPIQQIYDRNYLNL